MDLTEQMLSGMVKKPTEWLKAEANLNIPKDLTSEAAHKHLTDACEKFGIKCPPPQTTARLLNKVLLLHVMSRFNYHCQVGYFIPVELRSRS
jgi:hypothetical protein